VNALDALVLGGGPAGCAAAIELAGAGLSVAIAARAGPAGERFGESLSPAAGPLLRRLGALASFAVEGHLPCHANASAWGRPELAYHDFLNDPRGSGWHIDRAAFERGLIRRAESLGVRVLPVAAQARWSREQGAWQSPALPGERPRWMVDCTGRAGSFARAQGATWIPAWEQVALAAVATIEDEIAWPTLIEAVREGFWYSAPVPGRRLVVMLFTEAGIHDARRVSTVEGLLELLAATAHTAQRIASTRATFAAKPRFLPAGSGRLSRPFGEGWIAAGDAAMAYDPISAHGLTLALRTGIDAAAALIDGREEALQAYAGVLSRAFSRYRGEALRMYASERRWPAERYWATRHALAGNEVEQ
jgi:flavin-dependent dehydrogenase